MNDLLKFLILNIGKVVGILAGLIIALLIIKFGLLKTLFIIALVILGLILGKWYDEGISFGKAVREVLSSLRMDKWHHQ